MTNRLYLYNYALSNKNGESELSIPHYKDDDGNAYDIHSMASLTNKFDEMPLEYKNRFSKSQSILVQTRTLDSFKIKKIGFIKIDVEGHESEVVDGAFYSILKYKPTMLIEIEERNRKGIINIMKKKMHTMGYAGYFLLENDFRPIEEFDIVKYQLNPLKQIDYKAKDIPNYIIILYLSTEVIKISFSINKIIT